MKNICLDEELNSDLSSLKCQLSTWYTSISIHLCIINIHTFFFAFLIGLNPRAYFSYPASFDQIWPDILACECSPLSLLLDLRDVVVYKVSLSKPYWLRSCTRKVAKLQKLIKTKSGRTN